MSNTDYGFGTSESASEGPDNRADYRLTATARATLELESEVPGKALKNRGRDLVCRIRDISARGMCLFSPEPLSLGALLPATVVLGDHPTPFVLMVEVVWCRPNRSEFLVGVQIMESDGTGYVEWLDAVASAMEGE
ncbi:PilZ domain-containing protein [Marinobacter sp. M216]|uniref:PilZ domain-containing protein n=1 Tax=Marinobacter albus TaxID=3030833 RepID=A0ABT7HBM9_9GAMM|nr:PilZ domain-containing protein [Marinobacter sp. M216]MDK9557774.1 PilZ domain-containing protein [Marinobacter sp. M216]